MLSDSQALNLDLASLNNIHIIGIGSAFGNFCAKILYDMGKHITASELKQNTDAAQYWLGQGVLFPGNHSADYIHKDLDLVVFPNGPIPGNPECEQTEKFKLPAITIAQLTGLISKNLKTIAVVGTHGKSTTTAFIVWLLHKTCETPNFILGDGEDKIFELNTNAYVNPKSKYLVLEACEYKKQFLQRAPKPYISVVTSMALDHTDFYPTQESYNSAFAEFLDNTTNTIVIDTEQQVEKQILDQLTNQTNITDINQFRDELTDIKLTLPGKHNKENALRAYTVARTLKIDKVQAVEALQSFPGLTKRFELAGKTANGNLVYKDYAHNPDKLRAVIEAAGEAHPDKQIILVWQPHSVERSYTFKEAFAKAIEKIDTLWITDIFAPVREPEDYKKLITSEAFANYLAAQNPGKTVSYTGTIANTETKIMNIDKTHQNLVFVLASAGDLHKIATDLIAS